MSSKGRGLSRTRRGVKNGGGVVELLGERPSQVFIRSVILSPSSKSAIFCDLQQKNAYRVANSDIFVFSFRIYVHNCRDIVPSESVRFCFLFVAFRVQAVALTKTGWG
jgi:hypothetical protein